MVFSALDSDAACAVCRLEMAASDAAAFWASASAWPCLATRSSSVVLTRAWPATSAVCAASSVLAIVVSAERMVAYMLAMAASEAIFLTCACSMACVERRSLMPCSTLAASTAASRRRPVIVPLTLEMSEMLAAVAGSIAAILSSSAVKYASSSGSIVTPSHDLQ